MFRFWGSDIRGNQKSVSVCQPMHDCVKSQPVLPTAPHSALSLSTTKRRRSSIESAEPPLLPVAKRLKSETHQDATLASLPAVQRTEHSQVSVASSTPVKMNRVREIINFEIGHEILLKHNELRLIEQELAKCQVALEQLRRCHLIPYPVNCPTPDQLLDIMAGKGPAIQPENSTSVPEWAPPFGVVDGPYARHYAKWLIPDPRFDGMQVDFHIETRPKGIEGRTTRNSYSYSDGAISGKRPMRGLTSSQKLQSLSAGYPVKTDKTGPCTLVRQLDGIRVKLVCLDCNRENFSSTQGFINHCRIAHKRDYKSHEEAARKCGQPISSEASASTPAEEKPAVFTVTTPTSNAAPQLPLTSIQPGQVHPFTRQNLSEQETYVSLKNRIAECVKLFEDGLHPYSKRIPKVPTSVTPVASKASIIPSSDAPYLSEFLKRRNISKNLDEAVADAKKPVADDDLSDDSEEGDDTVAPAAIKIASVMRVPARPQSPNSSLETGPRPTSSKGRGHQPFAATHPITCSPSLANSSLDIIMRDTEDLEADLSPNTSASNNAPSLVSDDGEYDDSEVPSDSEADDSIAGNSVSDVAEINLEEESDGRPIRHHRSSSGNGPDTLRLKRDDVKHVSFVSPIKNGSKPIKAAGHGRTRKP